MLDVVNREVQAYDRVRMKLCARLGTINEDGSAWTFTGAKKLEFDRKLAELGEVTVCLPGGRIELADLGDEPLKPGPLRDLAWLIYDPGYQDEALPETAWPELDAGVPDDE
jgi:hypothetical protein